MGTNISTDDLELSIIEHDSLQDMVSKNKYQTEKEVSFEDVKDRIIEAFTTYIPEGLRGTSAAGRVIEGIREGRICPAGSILSIWGTDNVGSLSNCYLTPIKRDNIEAIFDATKELARTFSYRGGSGTDITVLRPKGAKVNNAALSSSGAVSFMPLLSETTHTIGQQGRRAALLISQDIRHPDTPDFIWCKSKPEEVFGKDPLTGRVPDVTGANISLKITDEFMEAVKDDNYWTFKFPHIDQVTLDFDFKDGAAYANMEVLRALDPAPGDEIQVYTDEYNTKTLEVLWVNWDSPQHIGFRIPEWLEDVQDDFPARMSVVYIKDGKTPVKDVYTTLWDGDYDKWEKEYGQICRTYDTVNARDLLKDIAASAHISGDPGMAYIDTVQKMTPGTYISNRLKPVGFNPCGSV
jgi:ribonucleoside-diphosphate reductase alpha chain